MDHPSGQSCCFINTCGGTSRQRKQLGQAVRAALPEIFQALSQEDVFCYYSDLSHGASLMAALEVLTWHDMKDDRFFLIAHLPFPENKHRDYALYDDLRGDAKEIIYMPKRNSPKIRRDNRTSMLGKCDHVVFAYPGLTLESMIKDTIDQGKHVFILREDGAREEWRDRIKAQ